MNQRIEFALKSLRTDNFAALCREYAISEKTGYKWKQRFLEKGINGMAEESRRPRGSPAGLAEDTVCRLVRLKERHPHWGPRKIRELYDRQFGEPPSESSVKRVLERSGLTVKRKRKRASESGRVASGRRAAAPNEVWTVDFKGWWYDPEGRCEPLTVRDEHSRYVLAVQSLEHARTAEVRECFERLFERHGLPGAIRSDNGAPFASANGLLGLTRLSAWWLALGIDLERGRPGCPQDNGAHERMHGDIQRELAGVRHEGRQAAFDVWRRQYNEERPHEALGMLVPAGVYVPSARKWQGTPDELVYEGLETRRVKANGVISWQGHRIPVSSSLAGWDVGLDPGPLGETDVYFARLLLGHIEESSAAFVAAITTGPDTGADHPEHDDHESA